MRESPQYLLLTDYTQDNPERRPCLINMDNIHIAEHTVIKEKGKEYEAARINMHHTFITVMETVEDISAMVTGVESDRRHFLRNIELWLKSEDIESDSEIWKAFNRFSEMMFNKSLSKGEEDEGREDEEAAVQDVSGSGPV